MGESRHIGLFRKRAELVGHDHDRRDALVGPAMASSFACRPPAMKTSEGLPGSPEIAMRTGSLGGCAVRAAGGSYTHAGRAWKRDCSPGMSTVPTVPVDGIPAGGVQSRRGRAAAPPWSSDSFDTPVIPIASPSFGK